MDGEEAIRCDGLHRSFNGFLAVDHLELTVRRNSIFGFLGPNGAGKTTTIRMLTGLIQPTEGTAVVAGVDARNQSLESRQRLGYLPENPYFYGWMTGEEFLRFVGAIFRLGGSELKSRVDFLLEQVGLEDARRRRVGGYSRGMKQRLGMAQALINEPSVVFLDEPCSALDPLGRLDVLNMIEKLGQEATVFMSTHILSDVDRICDSVAVLDKGRLVAQSSIEDLRRKYVTPVFRVEFDDKPTSFLSTLRSQDWVEDVEATNPRSFTVKVGDLEKAKDLLPRIVASDNANMTRYELSSPSLEDIFVRMVKQ